MIPLGESLFTMFGRVDDGDRPRSGPADSDPSGIAGRAHDWYRFEVAEHQVGMTIGLILAWRDDVELGYHLFTAPDNPMFGFRYLVPGEAAPEFEDELGNTLKFEGTFQAGSYLLAVSRDADARFPTGYSILSIALEP